MNRAESYRIRYGNVKKNGTFSHPYQVTQRQTDSSNKNLLQRRSWKKDVGKKIMERYTEDKKVIIFL